jgi:hypothetical protein
MLVEQRQREADFITFNMYTISYSSRQFVRLAAASSSSYIENFTPSTKMKIEDGVRNTGTGRRMVGFTASEKNNVKYRV